MHKSPFGSHSVQPLGQHITVDIFEASNLVGEQHIKNMMIYCANAAKATILKTHLHPFETNDGVSGMIILAESHISIHTWPKYHFAAMDIFMCGDANPHYLICSPVSTKLKKAQFISMAKILKTMKLAVSVVRLAFSIKTSGYLIKASTTTLCLA